MPHCHDNPGNSDADKRRHDDGELLYAFFFIAFRLD